MENIENNECKTLDTLSDIEEELSNIKTEQINDNLVDRQVQFFTTCMEQNLEHARHVEGERMNFVQIHLVLVGGVLAFLSERALDKKSITVLLILLAVTFLGCFVKVLIDRWNQVFVAHRTCAMHCYTRLAEFCQLETNSQTEFPADILDNVKRHIPDSLKHEIPSYPFTFSKSGKTGKIIRWFINGLIILSFFVTVSYFLKFWVFPLV